MTAQVFWGGVFLALFLGFSVVLLVKCLTHPIRERKNALDVWVEHNLGNRERWDWMNDRFLRQVCDNHLAEYRKDLTEQLNIYTGLITVTAESLIIYTYITFFV